MDSSIMEDSIFDDQGATSDDFAPVAATKAKAKSKVVPKATIAKSSSKAPAKKMTQTTLKSKPTASKKRSKPDDVDDDAGKDVDTMGDDSLLSVTPPSAKKQKKARAPIKKQGGEPLKSIENEGGTFDGPEDPKPTKGSAATEKYQKLTQLEHILKRPDTYIGSVERNKTQMWVYSSAADAMESREISFVPGLYKIFDEILVNAADNKQNDKNMDAIKVTVDRETGEISVWNNGKGIPVEIHEREKIYVPEMIFGHLLTSSNYDDDQRKVTGGRNGYGAKLCNIFSTEFTIETADSKSKSKYKQTWTDNMSKMGKAKITSNGKGDDYTKVTFKPDFSKFGMSGIDTDFEDLVKRRVYDLAGTCRGVKVSLNGDRIKIKDFQQYMNMYIKAISNEMGEGESSEPSKTTIIIDRPDERWEVGFAVSDGTFQQVSFVNSIATTSGGSHVNYVGDQIVDCLMNAVKKRNKGGHALKNNQVRNYIFLFVNCQIVNPAFTSQTKEQLTTKYSQFGSKCVLSANFLRKVAASDAVSRIVNFAQHKADQVLKKSDGNKRSRMNNPKLIDANKAGTREGWKCTLILTEGDSAKGLAVAGRSVVGPDEFGVFPLRGKLLNVRDASIEQISKNTEIQSIKQFIGLQHKKEYTDTKGLRYGHIMIMTDQDHDGSHIKGLLINFLQCTFPSLLKIPTFLIEFITPIVKVWKGDPKNPRQAKSFFTMPEYETWQEEHKHERAWDHKYYKGLGTSTTEDAQVYFRDLDRHLKEFHTMHEREEQLIDLAFSKKKADERKEWLREFKPGTFLDHTIDKISYTDFVNKELILFSMADNMRSIPSVIDGLKPGQRKVLYACFKRNVKKDIKVVELAGHVSGLTAYQHGDASLQQTITGLAQTFVGSNNINCLEPSGNFGSRLQGGSDCASARYIYTRLSPFARLIFNTLDDPLLKYNIDDNHQIEPETYCPIVPMVLVNGADGIGTGWSTSIPNYNPEDIVDNLKRLMDDDKQVPMVPWFRGWAGEVKQVAPDRYKFSGIIKQTGDNEIEITELPIRLWTQDFKDKLEDIIKAEKVPSFIKDYKDYNTHLKVNFVIQMEDKYMKLAVEEGLEEKFKLSKTLATSNLVAFDRQGRLHKYNAVEEIMEEFYKHRLNLYEKRKAYQISELQKELEKMSNQARFIQMIIDGKLVVAKKRKGDLVRELQQKDFKPFPKVKDASKAGETEPVVENDEEGDQDIEAAANAYDYLLGMAIWSLTKERVEKLLRIIGDKEEEVDALLKLSVKDLWKKDLDDFIAEWRFQLEDDHKRQRKVAISGRRGSAKLKIGAKGPAAKKRKALGDDPEDGDFAVSKPKKAAVVTRVPPKAVSSFFQTLKNSTSPPAKSTTSGTKASLIAIDGASDPIEDNELDGTTPPRAGGKARTTIKPGARKARAAAAKPVKYDDSDESGSDNGDDMLGDVSKMVKGIAGDEPSNGSRALFSASTSNRPSSSAGLATKAKPKPATKQVFNLSDDETDFSKLLPKSPNKSKRASTINGISMSDHEEDDSLSMEPAPKAAAAKQRAKPAPKAVSKPAAKTIAKKPTTAPLSTAAKAYAAKQGKKPASATKPPVDDDTDMESPNEDDDSAQVSSPPPQAAVIRRPARAARATAKKQAWVDSDSGTAESESEEEEEEDFDDDN
ncbi:MAG: DNA topoisomerase 2 [Piccolia ochrophora]|nr:MAG: DNA topoisomerase 2 [Piccolia ochrophora]